MNKLLIIQSISNQNISEILFSTVSEVLELTHNNYEYLEVYDILSIPCAASISLEAMEYKAIIALGCVIGYSLEHEVWYKECIRGLNDIAMHYTIPVGIGIFIAKAEEDAMQLAPSSARAASLTCIQLLKIKNHLGFTEHEPLSKYSN